MNTLKKHFTLLLLTALIIHTISATTDTINVDQNITDGQTMVSSGGRYELRFFSPRNSNNHYGMWYRNISDNKVVWVANRANPLTTNSGVLRVVEPGILVLLNDTDNNDIMWSSNTSTISVENPIAQLLDNGNLIVRDAYDDRPENFIWQSFDYPSDTFIPGTRFGWNHVTGVETYVSSWKTDEDPSPGYYTCHLDTTGYPQIVMRHNNAVTYRIGPWNGILFSGFPNMKADPTYSFTLTMNANEVQYFEYDIDRSFVSRFTISPGGIGQRSTWVDQTQEWVPILNIPGNVCDRYKNCGVYGSCNMGNSPACGCLDRFLPRDPGGWNISDWSNGCVRRTNLSCRGDVFLKYSGIKLPDSRHASFYESAGIEECETECSRSCSCMAYTRLDLSNGNNGCLLWFDDLVDIRTLSEYGSDLYIRMASSELESQGKKRVILIASLTSVMVMVLVGLILILYLQRRKHDLRMRGEGKYNESDQRDSELPLFKLSTILKATDYFSIDNKLGEGGFGPVYKGVLEGGQEIAVKRLSGTSTQGLDEFKNEVIFIAKLQHRNLVRILGCCIQRKENMLVYEYMANNSLDVILFDKSRNIPLDWPTRFHIINGIARGLLYLHQDSRLRIIHRDLKASNILLDADMNPKISDFGTARSFGGNETEAKTRRIVGTYGYMSPEYAVDGRFSVKSDVYSFGVLVLEIVSGKRNRGFSHSDHHLNLLGHAWTLYKEDRSLEMVDASLAGSIDLSEVQRTIHVGLLCVQKKIEDRPSMSSVVLMLGNEGVFPVAKQPGFFTERELLIAKNSTSINAANSTNEVTITLLQPR